MIKVFRLKGTFGQKGQLQEFTIDVRAMNSEQAKEKLYADVGSKHKVKRYLIKINSIEEIKPEETKSLLVGQLSEGE